MRILYFALLVLLGMVSGCSKPPAPKPDVIILHSGRMRGNVYPLSLQALAPLQHYPYLAGYIRKVRAEAAACGAQVFVVDLGDSLGGSFAVHVTGSQNMTAFFNETGYDAVFLSNLDATVPEAAIKELKCKVLNPFERATGSSDPGGAAGAVVTKGKTPLFLLSNFYGEVDPGDHPERFPTRFGAWENGVLPVRDYAKVLRGLGERPEGALTVFGWMKFEPAEAPPAEFLEQLKALGIDAILAHRIYAKDEREAWQSNGFVDWTPPVSLNILRNNGGFALARLDLAREGSHWRVLRHELLPMTANVAPSDPAVVSVIEKFSREIAAADTPVLELEAPVDAGKILKIYMAALATIPGTDAVAYSGESIRSDWPSGLLHASGIFYSLPWATGLAQIHMTPSQLAALARSGLVRVAAKVAAESDGITLTTSRYFADLIAREPEMGGIVITDLPQKSEFDYFLQYLRSNPGAISAGFPDGWTESP